MPADSGRSLPARRAVREVVRGRGRPGERERPNSTSGSRAARRSYDEFLVATGLPAASSALALPARSQVVTPSSRYWSPPDPTGRRGSTEATAVTAQSFGALLVAGPRGPVPHRGVPVRPRRPGPACGPGFLSTPVNAGISVSHAPDHAGARPRTYGRLSASSGWGGGSRGRSRGARTNRGPARTCRVGVDRGPSGPGPTAVPRRQRCQPGRSYRAPPPVVATSPEKVGPASGLLGPGQQQRADPCRGPPARRKDG